MSRCAATRFPKEPVPPVIRIVEPEAFMPMPRRVYARPPRLAMDKACAIGLAGLAFDS